jgi:hypothetical protein
MTDRIEEVKKIILKHKGMLFSYFEEYKTKALEDCSKEIDALYSTPEQKAELREKIAKRIADSHHRYAVMPSDFDYADSILSLVDKPEPTRTKIICLCGSTRFKDAFMSEYARLSDAGNIVLTVSRLIPDHRDLKDWDFPEQEAVWHELHFRKIVLADEVRVLNVGGYIGKSLKAEIEYATKIGKPITYLEVQNG